MYIVSYRIEELFSYEKIDASDPPFIRWEGILPDEPKILSPVSPRIIELRPHVARIRTVPVTHDNGTYALGNELHLLSLYRLGL